MNKSWTIKEVECWRIDAFALWCWRRLLGIPWTARRSNQSILKESNPEYSLEVLILKLKFQYFGHLMRIPWCWETWLDNITKSTDMNLSKLQEMVGDRGTWSPWCQRVRHNLATEQQPPTLLVWGKFLPGDSGWLGLRGKEQLVSGSRRRKVRSDSAPRKSQDTFRRHNTRGSASIYSHPPWTPTLPSPIFCGPKLSKSPQEPHCQLSDSWRQKTWVSYRNHLHFQRDFENLDKNYISSIIKFKLSHKHENLF